MKIKTLQTVFLSLPYWRIKNNITVMGVDDYLKNSVLLLFGFFVCGAEYFFFSRFWEILSTIPMGFILVLPKLISFVGTFMFAFLAYSSIMTTLTALYRSNDLTVFLVSPTPLWLPLFYKWCEIAIRSGVTFLVLSIPPVIALYQWLDLTLSFLLVYIICILSLASIAVCVGTLFGMGLMSVFPEKRLHQSVAIVGLCLAAAMIGGMRFLNIENMWSEMPEQSEIIQYFMQPDTSIWVRYAPAALLSNAMMPFLWNSSGGWMWTGINVLSGFAAVTVTLWIGTFLFPLGWQKSQEQNDPAVLRTEKNPFLHRPNYLPGNFTALMIKDWMILWRDPNIWTQLFMMVPLAAIYILNMAMLPLDADGMQLLFTISNVGLIGMITAAVCARFLYPTVSREGRSIWISAKAPVSSTHLVIQKILFACPPVLLVSITLLIASTFLLDISYPQLIWMLLYGVSLVVMLCILAVSMGCWFPMFDYQHLMEVSLGKGALLFMFLALMMVSTLMYSAYQSSNPSGNIELFSVWFVSWFSVWFGVTITALWRGKRRLDILDID